ncbi:putative pectinesterase 63 [Tasmannia lanceolata]|uniref:putative pectinesterase 63 n=1 Tax=Tasmannia lanceolata TaxID=3420 RepID=UPI004064256A
MAGKRTHAVVLATLVTMFIGLHLVHSAPANSGVPIPAKLADIDAWFSQYLKSTTLEPSVVNGEKTRKIITVSKQGKADFNTIMGAINSIPDANNNRTIIKIGPGVYKEKVIVNPTKPFITFYGQPDNMPTISWDDTARKQHGTYNSATVAIESGNFMAVNMIFENSAPCPADGEEGGQAVAMRIAGDKAAFYNCRFNGFQDTLLDKVGKHFFKDCFIKGTVDFIFGDGRSIYLNTVISSVAKGLTAITAQGRTTVADESGFSFVHCNVTGTGKAYLSRAWMPSSRVVFAYSFMDTVVLPEGWDDKGDAERDRTVFYGEYMCEGPGASTKGRVSFGKVLNGDQVRPFLSMNYIQASLWLLPPPTL